MNKKQILGIALFLVGILMFNIRLEKINVPELSTADNIYSAIACVLTLAGMLLGFCRDKTTHKP